MSTEYPTLLHRWFDEVWNQKTTETIDAMLTEDSLHHGVSGPGGEPIRGTENFKAFHAAFLDAFPDLHVEIHDVIREGDKLAALYTVEATHNGPLLGREATGRRVKFQGSGMCRVEGDKFVEVWNVIDFEKMNFDLDA